MMTRFLAILLAATLGVATTATTAIAQPTPAQPREATTAEVASGSPNNGGLYISPRRFSGSGSILPAQAGQSGKFLTTDGSVASWGTLNLSAYLPLAGGTMTGNITFGDTGEGLTLHGGGTLTGAGGAVTVTPTTGNVVNAGAAAIAAVRIIGSTHGRVDMGDSSAPTGFRNYQFMSDDGAFQVRRVNDDISAIFATPMDFNATGGIALTASGTNQSITLTPSGTGSTAMVGPASVSTLLTLSSTLGTSAGGIAFGAGAGDVFLFRKTNQQLMVSGATEAYMEVGIAGVLKAYLATDTTAQYLYALNSLAISSGGTTALTLGSDQTFAFAKPGTISVGATTSALTDLLINPTTKASGNLIDAQVNGSSKMSLTSAGVLTLPSATGVGYNSGVVVTSSAPATTAKYIAFTGGAVVDFEIRNANGSGAFGICSDFIDLRGGAGALLVRIGGTSASFPAFKNTGAALNFRLADDSADAAITAGAGTFSGQLIGKGTATNDAAAAGVIGELLSAQRLVASTLSLTTATAADITSLSLTAGDWEVYGTVHFIPANTTVVSSLVGSVSATTATQASVDSVGGYASLGAVYTSGGATMSATPIPVRISLAATTTYYLVATATFSASTTTAYGTIRARRVR